MDHVVLVLFENRSLDNLLGHLYGPEDGKAFEGVIGKDLSNPIPEWAEHGAERRTVPYTVATDMDAPNPDSGEEYFHTNTQLYNTLASALLLDQGTSPTHGRAEWLSYARAVRAVLPRKERAAIFGGPFTARGPTLLNLSARARV